MVRFKGGLCSVVDSCRLMMIMMLRVGSIPARNEYFYGLQVAVPELSEMTVVVCEFKCL